MKTEQQNNRRKNCTEEDYISSRSRFKPLPSEALLDQLIRHMEKRSPNGMVPLRFSIADSSPNELGVEATYFSRSIDRFKAHVPSCRSQHACASAVAHIVPTSVGASVGGFAGDASPATQLLAQVAETVITHPNVVNASDILSMPSNTLYVEGSLLDSFFLGQIALRPVRSNTVGVIIEKQPQRFVDYVRYSVDAAHATCGIPIAGYALTREKIGARVRRFGSGAYTGIIENPKALLEAGERLVSIGATAIAVTSEILDIPDVTRYVQGLEPNPHGGVEALISHTVARHFGLPAAHAPMWGESSPREDQHFAEYDPREAAELVTVTALGCILQGLHKAPQPVLWDCVTSGDLSVSNILALITPFSSIGNIPALACDKIGIPIIGVRQNTTVHKIRPEHLNLKHYYQVENYFEAAGFIAALRAGISISSLRRPIYNIEAV